MSVKNKVRMLKAPRSSSIKLPVIRQQQMETCSRTATYIQDVTDLLEKEQMQSILRKMPVSFRKKFRPELRRQKPLLKKNFHHHDFHGSCQAGEAILHGVILLGRDHHDMMGEEPPEPETPPPLSGRKHCHVQTDIYLENIADDDSDPISKEVQCDPLEDEILEPPNLTFEKEGETTTGTQLDQWKFPDLDELFGQISTNLADSVIMESLRQLQEEYELHSLIVQRDRHQCIVDYELALLEKYKKAKALLEEQENYLKNRKPWEETLDEIIDLVGFDKIRDIAPEHFISDQQLRAIMEHIDETMVPPVNEKVRLRVQLIKNSCRLLDAIIEEAVAKREAEYAGKMFTRDPRFKVSLASESQRPMSGTYNNLELDEEEEEEAEEVKEEEVSAEERKSNTEEEEDDYQRKSEGKSSGKDGADFDYETRGSFESEG